MTGKKGVKILDPRDLDFPDERGKEWQRRREEAMEKRRKEE
jgi:hypothetical protein